MAIYLACFQGSQLAFDSTERDKFVILCVMALHQLPGPGDNPRILFFSQKNLKLRDLSELYAIMIITSVPGDFCMCFKLQIFGYPQKCLTSYCTLSYFETKQAEIVISVVTQ